MLLWSAYLKVGACPSIAGLAGIHHRFLALHQVLPNLAIHLGIYYAETNITLHNVLNHGSLPLKAPSVLLLSDLFERARLLRSPKPLYSLIFGQSSHIKASLWSFEAYTSCFLYTK